MLSGIIRLLEQRSRLFVFSFSLGLCLLIGGVDYLIKEDLTLSIFYLTPIALAAWFIDRRTALVLSVLCTVIWFQAEVAAKKYDYGLLPYWNAATRLGFFVIVTCLLATQKQAYENEKRWARTDGLTNVFNQRYFLEILQTELDRACRYHYPVTLAYLDLDNFKQVNDRLGHSEGDRVLQAIAQQIKASLRTSDVIARMGGDEFALLLPQIEYAQAQIALSRLHQELKELSQQRSWSVGFSIGAVTTAKLSESAERLIQRADRLMYAVKQSGKNKLQCEEDSQV
ncbi:MAG: GGDEF domain-containing protein [Leptolyngbyaceae cyanobacterium SM1_1_3]|nr:GGDEF domain-containing protein [Leptolyngbyaceae cyanobacterium SM1_1_3]NJO09068.1 GGDEF domain-containing protein [Leptolyngbyaceae cyanobacterium SL_1_1]